MQELSYYIDVDDALSRVRGNVKLYHRLVGMFVNGKELPELESTLSGGDYATAGDLAHAIKGMAGNLGMKPLFDVSARLMKELRAGAPSDELTAEYRDTLEATLSHAKAMLGN